MSITKAVRSDIHELEKLVNNAYRGTESKKGWTSEADLLGGIRIDEPELVNYFNDQQITLLNYKDQQDKIIGTVYLELKTNGVLYLGMLSVSPLAQGKNIGKALLEAAESFAKEHDCNIIRITVISVRETLIDFYKRRGYVFTGETMPFEGNGKFGIAKGPLEFIVMEKNLLLLPWNSQKITP